MHFKFKRQSAFTSRGVSLLELLLALSLIVVIFIAIGGYYTVTRNARQTTEAYTNIQVIGGACQSWWEDNGHSFAGLTFTKLTDKGYLSDSYSRTPWGSTVELTRVNDQQVKISLNNTPGKVCNALMNRFLGPDQSCFVGTTFSICMDGNKNYAACSS